MPQLVAVPPPSPETLPFGAADPAAVRWRISDGHTIAADICQFGATLISLWVRDRGGQVRDVVLGCDSVAGYRHQRAYLGASIGRFANRISSGRMSLEGRVCRLSANEGDTVLHGGATGFDRAPWQLVSHAATALTLSHVSPDGDQGFPGTLRTVLTFEVGPGPRLAWTFQAETDAATAVNLTNHSYFNLSGTDTVGDHRLTVLADRVLKVGPGLIPTGQIMPVAGTALDFQTPTRLADRWQAPDPLLQHSAGIDHCFVRPAPATLTPFARLEAPDGGVVMRVDSDAIGLQVYAGQHLDGSIIGKHGIAYGPGAGLCLEPQGLPDSPNHPHFPPPWLQPGAVYTARSAYVFEP